MSQNTAYQKLEQVFKEISDINGSISMLNWDMATMMGDGSAQPRSQQIATLSTIAHDKITAHEISDLIGEVKDEVSGLTDWQRSNIKLMEREFLHANAVDSSLVRELSLAGSQCEMVWRKARESNDFLTYAPYQQKVLDLVRQVAKAKADSFNVSPYDALLDQFDAGSKSADIDDVFTQLQEFLPSLISDVIDRQKFTSSAEPFATKFPQKNQRELGLHFMKSLGFDFTRGRLDTSHHPFCGGVPQDVRITTRYDEDNFCSAMMGVLHETGHALYEQGLPREYSGQPVGEALGMSVHESQSLLIEMQLSRSREFLEFAAPIIQRNFDSDKALSQENLFKMCHKVERSFIRVDADELTYPVHVIIRYNIEKALISGEIEINDVPEIWNKLMKEMLDIDVPDYNNGCMQDIHWTDGAFGYFPTYTLGAIYAAQFFNKAKQDIPNLNNDIREGNFNPLVAWLRKNIHNQGSKLNSTDLLQQVTGEDVNVGLYKNHLKNRYLK